ncbi:MAG: hypothetical protein PQJ50_00080 [Spirochaetales bacterium]|nr:hypothetical protein [Spirochaetales bacterium]
MLKAKTEPGTCMIKRYISFSIPGLLLFFFVNSASLFGEEVGSRTIEHFEIYGLKRTKTDYILSLLEQYRGFESSGKTADLLQTDIYETGLFSDIKLEFEEEGTVAVITVSEKRSFIPIPVISYKEGDFAFGAVIRDSNAFGYADNFTFGFIYGLDDIAVAGSYRSKGHHESFPGHFVTSVLRNGRAQIVDEIGNPLIGYDYLSIESTAGLSVDFGSAVTLESGFFYGYYDIGDIIFTSTQLFSINISTVLSSSKWSGYFLNRREVKGYSALTYSTNTSSFPSIGLTAVIQERLVLDRLRFYFLFDAIFSEDSYDGRMTSPYASGFTILSKDYKSEKFIGSVNGIELALGQSEVGTFSLTFDYQILVSDSYAAETVFSQGIAWGGKLYLKKIAFPALSVGGAYNISQRDWYFSAAFGLNL